MCSRTRTSANLLLRFGWRRRGRRLLYASRSWHRLCRLDRPLSAGFALALTQRCPLAASFALAMLAGAVILLGLSRLACTLGPILLIQDNCLSDLWLQLWLHSLGRLPLNIGY
jgi:hypothetical protein